jgi:peptidoglycan/LPS O-acetylase OafA/YrhL
MRNNKIPEIDFLRAISALAVITIHVTAKFTEIPTFNNLQLSIAFIDNFVGFAVPSFIFISGMVLFQNYSTLQTNILTFYKKRFAKIIPIYLLFSVFLTSTLLKVNFITV